MAKTTAGVLIAVADRLLIQVTPFSFPAEQAIRSARDPWLARDLHLFNLAYRQDDHATALRLLHLLCEDAIPPGLENLQYVRNFVSHRKITKKDTVAFIQSELGPGTDSYNPLDQRHRNLVRDWRNRAEDMLRAALQVRLR
jgi:hypothetical protein